DLMKQEPRAGGTRVAGGDAGRLGRGAGVDGPAERGGPEGRELARVSAVDAQGEQRDGHELLLWVEWPGSGQPSRPPSIMARLDGRAAAVSGQDRAGDVAGLRRGEEADQPGDLLRAGGAAHRGGGTEGGGALGNRTVGVDRAGRDRVDPHPAGA